MAVTTTAADSWVCLTCAYVYDEAEGDPGTGLPPGTRWIELPEDWRCPDCGTGKHDFERIEEPAR